MARGGGSSEEGLYSGSLGAGSLTLTECFEWSFGTVLLQILKRYSGRMFARDRSAGSGVARSGAAIGDSGPLDRLSRSGRNEAVVAVGDLARIDDSLSEGQGSYSQGPGGVEL